VPGSGLTSFSISEETGEIFANRAFDRDEPENERKLTVPVRVIDGGNPPLDNVCILIVEVEDVNDNEPLFDRAEYQATVPKDTPINAEVLSVSATDIDDGPNAVITFTLAPDPSFQSDVDYFDIVGGRIFLKKSLNNVNEGTKLRLIASAEDSGYPSKSTTVKVIVDVVEPALKPPIWTGLEEIHVPETYSTFEKPVATYTVQS
jgi:hypothetical protein